MPDLPRDLRRTLESTVKAAREAAQRGAEDALRRLGVFECRRPAHLDDARNAVRKRLRAHAKSLGDRPNGEDGAPLPRLTEAAAYVQWHRLLFARFLAERVLLRDADGITISLADCRDEAAMAGLGAHDEWSAARASAADRSESWQSLKAGGGQGWSSRDIVARHQVCSVQHYTSDSRWYYSMTSSARSRTSAEIVKPNAAAVFKLTTNLKTFGRSTGRSLGFAPLSILSVYAADRRIKV